MSRRLERIEFSMSFRWTGSLFPLSCITPALCWSQIVVDSSLDMRIAKKQIGPGCRSRYRRYIMWPMGPWFPAKIASLGNVTGGRKLARYVLSLGCGRYRPFGGRHLCPFSTSGVASSASASNLGLDTGVCSKS